MWTSPVATSLFLLLVVLNATAAQGQSPPSCPLMDTKEAAALTGPGVEFYSAIQSTTPDGKKTYVCHFGVGEGRTLTVKTGPSLARNAADYQKMYEPLRKMNEETLEPGLGEYASSKLESDTAHITVLKGTLTLTLELKGSGLSAADMDTLRATTRKVIAKVP